MDSFTVPRAPGNSEECDGRTILAAMGRSESSGDTRQASSCPA